MRNCRQYTKFSVKVEIPNDPKFKTKVKSVKRAKLDFSKNNSRPDLSKKFFQIKFF
jgi:hypothetical protein